MRQVQNQGPKRKVISYATVTLQRSCDEPSTYFQVSLNSFMQHPSTFPDKLTKTTKYLSQGRRRVVKNSNRAPSEYKYRATDFVV